MKEKLVLAILGSPHPNGITASMWKACICGAERAGYAVAKINLYEKQLAFCTGCRRCLAQGDCVQKDDLQEIVSLLRESQVVVLAAPVYWANVPAPVKNLFDRLLGAAMEETATFPKPRLAGKRYVFLTSLNTPAPFSWIFGQSRGAVRNVDEFFRTAGMKPMGKIVCAGTGRRKRMPERVQRRIERMWR